MSNGGRVTGGITIRTGSESISSGSLGGAGNYPNELRPEVLWIRSFLEAYCGPGRHNFLFATPRGLAWCTSCFKEQPPGAAICLVCDSRAVQPVKLTDVHRKGEPVAGGLCTSCLQAFHEERQLGAWHLQE